MVFLTALLMAEPREFREPVPQIKVRTLDLTGWSAPQGWYGFVPAAGSGIVRRAGGMSPDDGLNALERLGNPEQESRSQEFDGRRLIRVNGGYLVLNFEKYRERDYGAAERTRRWRERQRVTRNGDAVTRNVTQAEAEAENRSRSSESKTTASGFAPDSPPMALASHLFARMRENNPNAKEPNFQAWAAAIDLMLRRDKREPDDVRRIIDFAQEDTFWRANILSAEKLREKYDTLTMQAKRRHDGGNGRDKRGSDSAAEPNRKRPINYA